MRKVTKEIIEAFKRKEKRTVGNTSTINGKLFLHGNMIAKWLGTGELLISHCGWKTVTTKERLNGLPNVSVSQANFIWYLNGKQWNTLYAIVKPTGSPESVQLMNEIEVAS